MIRPVTLLALVSVVSLTAAFDAHAEGPAWKVLRSDRATATSYLKSNWNKYDENYHPAYVLDGNPNTAWVEGVDGNGEGQSLTIPLSGLQSARALRLRIFNGYQKSKNLLGANAAPKDVTVDVTDSDGSVVGTTKATLQKTMGAQEVVVAIKAGRSVSGVTVRVDSTWPGRVYKDSCISDIDVAVDSDVAYSAKAEQAKLSSLNAWIRERKDTAKRLASIKKDYPFAATHFVTTSQSRWDSEEISTWDDVKERWQPVAGMRTLDQQFADGKPSGITAKRFSVQDWQDLLALRAISQDKGASVAPTWQRVDVAALAPLPDGVEELGGYLPTLKALGAFFDLSSVTFFEAQGEAGGNSRSKSKNPEVLEWVPTWTTTNARVARHADGKTPRRVYFAEHRIVQERETVDETDHYLVDFNEAGRVTRILRFGGGRGFLSATIVDVSLDGAGHVTSMTQRSVSGGTGVVDDLAEMNNTISTQSVTIAAAGDT